MLRAVEFLISRGHREQDVLHRYSLAKIELYADAGAESTQQELLEELLVQHNPKQMVKHLREAAKVKQRRQLKKKSKISRGPSHADINKLRELARGRR